MRRVRAAKRCCVPRSTAYDRPPTTCATLPRPAQRAREQLRLARAEQRRLRRGPHHGDQRQAPPRSELTRHFQTEPMPHSQRLSFGTPLVLSCLRRLVVRPSDSTWSADRFRSDRMSVPLCCAGDPVPSALVSRYGWAAEGSCVEHYLNLGGWIS